MNWRKPLVLSVTSLAVVGAILAIIPFALSLTPSESAGESLPRIDVSKLLPGSFITQNHPTVGKAEHRYYVLKDFESKIYLFHVYLSDNQVQLPYFNWWSSGSTCSNFGPEHENGALKIGGVIKCHDEDEYTASSWWAWTFEGQNISGERPDMETLKYSVVGPHIVVGR